MTNMGTLILYEYQEHCCNYCGRRMGIEYLIRDHKNPKSRGGADRHSNYQLLCSPCKGRKGALTDGDFRHMYAEAGLAPAREADGPPQRVISQEVFQAIDGRIKEKAKARRG